jgi:AICAR transformylase/IMP cyclohydrolase PurH
MFPLREINKLFFIEVVVIMGCDADALTILQRKKEPDILVQNRTPEKQVRTCLNGHSRKESHNYGQ